MANPDFYLCDICGARISRHSRIFVCTGRHTDGAGGMEDTGEHIDLCETHAMHALSLMIRNNDMVSSPNHEAGTRLLQWVRKGKAANAKK